MYWFLIVLLLIVILTAYSIAEYLLQKHFHPDTTDRSSFLITPEYAIAFGSGIVEFLIERYFFPYKSSNSNIFIYIGFVCIVVGLTIRFSAILHAGKSFTHRIAFSKKPEHKLVTDGIYRYIRHPSYLGFLIFAVGSQVYLTNPICVIGFYIKLYSFFSQRIRIEEEYLIKMFPDYVDYRAKTPTWMFI